MMTFVENSFLSQTQLTLLFAVSYISPSTFLAYETRLPIRRSLRAAGSCTGVGKMAVTLQDKIQS